MECTLRYLRGVLALWDIVVAAMAKIKFYTFNLKEVNYNWLDGKMEKDDLFNNWSDSTYELGRELELITQFVLQFRAHCWQTDEHFLTTFNQWRQQFNIQSITNFNIMTYAKIDLWKNSPRGDWRCYVE